MTQLQMLTTLLEHNEAAKLKLLQTAQILTAALTEEQRAPSPEQPPWGNVIYAARKLIEAHDRLCGTDLQHFVELSEALKNYEEWLKERKAEES